jgi:hypothetical protein
MMEPREQTTPHPLLRTGPALVFFLLVSLLYNWYYLTCGFMGEDFMFLNMLRQDPLPISRWLGFWASADYPALTSIWWFEGQGTTPFWRPVPSLIIEGSVRLFGERAFPLHFFFVVVHGLVGGTLFLLVRRLTGRSLAALLAGLFFLSCEDHAMGVGWIAAGTDLVCALFVNLSLVAHVFWLDRRKPWALAASIAALVPALLSKESAVIVPVAICLMTLVMPRGRDTELAPLSRSSLRAAFGLFLRDWLSWFPAVALLILYLGLYKLIGFGGFTSGMYVDPLANPVGYLVHLLGHVPVMWLATLSPVPPSLAMLFPASIPLLAVGGAVAFLVWIVALWCMRKRGLVVWAMGFYLIALLPQMAADASERALYFPMIGASILLALLLVQIGPIARRIAPVIPSPPKITRVVGWVLLVGVLIPGAVLSATMSMVYGFSFDKPYQEAMTAMPHVLERDPEHVIVLNTSGPMHIIYLHPIVQYHGGSDLDVRVLSSMNAEVSVERIDEQSFVLRADRGGWLTNMFAGMLRGRGNPRPGRVFERGIMAATFLETTKSGRDILAARFAFDSSLEDPDILFIQWDGDTFSPIDLAALPEGERVTLADTSDVWASMW